MSAALAAVPALRALLHGELGGWDEIAMTVGSVVIGVALAYALKPRKGAVDPDAPPDDEATDLAAPPDATEQPTVGEDRPKAGGRS